MTVEGADISHHNGILNLPRLKNAGAQFVFIKCMDGAFNNDNTYPVNHKAAQDAGLMTAPYLFMRALQDGKSQADNLLKHMLPSQFPPVLDVEWDKNRAEQPDKWAGIGVAQRLQVVGRAIQCIKAALGVLPIIYTSRSFWNPTFGQETKYQDVNFGDCPLWVVDYNQDRVDPLLPFPWKTWLFRQYSGTGTLAGYHPIDRNCFNGSLDDLNKLAKTIQAPAT
jgi:lysozyme